MRQFAPLFAALSILTGASAQDVDSPKRQSSFGRVFTTENKPWAGATVVLIAWPYPRYWHAGTPDEIRAITDDTGKFEVKLLPQRHYSAWGFAKNDGGGFRLTGVAEQVVPFYQFRLQERPHAQPPIRVKILGLDGPMPLGPLSFQLVSRTPRNVFVHDLVLDDDNGAVVPALPGTWTSLVASTRNGVRVWLAGLPLSVGRRKIASSAAARTVPPAHVISGQEQSLSTFRLPKPTNVRFYVTGSSGPIANAEILVGAQSSSGSIGDVHDCRPIRRTNEKGEATTPMYLEFQADGTMVSPSPDVIVRAAGHSEQLYRMMRGLDGKRERPSRARPEVHVKLTGPGRTITGRLLLARGKPAARVPLLLYQSYSSGTGGSSISTKPFVFRTAADGTFRIPGRTNAKPYRLTALLPTTEATTREEVYVASSTKAELRDPAATDFGTFDISSFVTVDFRVVMADGSPADRARVYLGEMDDTQRPRTPISFLTDRVGRCSVRVPPTAALAVFVAHQEGFAIDRLKLPAQKTRTTRRLKLAAGGWLRGTAVDTKGQPMAKVRIYVRGGGDVDRSLWYQRFVSDISSTTFALNYRGIYTDDQGRFRAAFPQAGVKLQVNAWRRDPDGSYWGAKGKRREVVLEAEGMEQLRFVLERTR